MMTQLFLLLSLLTISQGITLDQSNLFVNGNALVNFTNIVLTTNTTASSSVWYTEKLDRRFPFRIEIEEAEVDCGDGGIAFAISGEDINYVGDRFGYGGSGRNGFVFDVNYLNDTCGLGWFNGESVQVMQECMNETRCVGSMTGYLEYFGDESSVLVGMLNGYVVFNRTVNMSGLPELVHVGLTASAGTELPRALISISQASVMFTEVMVSSTTVETMTTEEMTSTTSEETVTTTIPVSVPISSEIEFSTGDIITTNIIETSYLSETTTAEIIVDLCDVYTCDENNTLTISELEIDSLSYVIGLVTDKFTLSGVTFTVYENMKVSSEFIVRSNSILIIGGDLTLGRSTKINPENTIIETSGCVNFEGNLVLESPPTGETLITYSCHKDRFSSVEIEGCLNSNEVELQYRNDGFSVIFEHCIPIPDPLPLFVYVIIAGAAVLLIVAAILAIVFQDKLKKAVRRKQNHEAQQQADLQTKMDDLDRETLQVKRKVDRLKKVLDEKES